MVTEFVRQLVEEGRIRLQSADPASADDVRRASMWMIEAELETRTHLAFTPPGIDEDAVKWGVDLFYAAAQLAMYRHLGEDELQRRLRKDCPAPFPATAYSVDLTFRFLPDLTRIVRGMNPNDPLLSVLQSWAHHWPLSSVGMKDLGGLNVESILSDRSLTLLYVDRIIEHEDTARLGDSRVAELVRGAIGAYPELHPKLHRIVTESIQPTLDAKSE